MLLNLRRSWEFIKEFKPFDFSDEFNNLRSFWNSHDQGSRQWSTLSTSGGVRTGLTSKSANYRASYYDQIILADSTSGAVTITLPTAIGGTGQRYTVKDWKGKAATNNITIATTATQTIDGAATKVMNVNYQSYTVVSDGANWSVI